MKGLDPRVEPPPAEPVEDPRRVGAVPRGAEVVRPRGQHPHVLAQRVGLGMAWNFDSHSRSARADAAVKPRRGRIVGRRRRGQRAGRSSRAAARNGKHDGLGAGEARIVHCRRCHPPRRRHRGRGRRLDGRDLRRRRRRRHGAARADARRRPQDSHQRRRPLQHPPRARGRDALRHRLLAPHAAATSSAPGRWRSRSRSSSASSACRWSRSRRRPSCFPCRTARATCATACSRSPRRRVRGS